MQLLTAEVSPIVNTGTEAQMRDVPKRRDPCAAAGPLRFVRRRHGRSGPVRRGGLSRREDETELPRAGGNGGLPARRRAVPAAQGANTPGAPRSTLGAQLTG